MFNLFKKKPEEKKDFDLDCYENDLEKTKEKMEKEGFEFLQVEYGKNEYTKAKIVKKERFLQFDISKLDIIWVKDEKEYNLKLPHCVLCFHTKERAMEVQLMWANFLLEYQKKNKINE